MRRALAGIVPLAAAIVLPGAAVAGSDVEITIEPGFANVFDPDEASAELGQATFTFVWQDPPTDDPHNVREAHRLFYSGSPTVDSEDFPVEASAGTYSYLCDIHGPMTGELSVSPIAGEPAADASFRVEWATGTTETGDRFDVRYRVGDGDWAAWRTDTTKLGSRFAHRGEPDVEPGESYSFRARSQKPGKPQTSSGWSPKLEVTGG